MIDLNEEFTEDENEVEFEEPRRPIGKKKGKRVVSLTSSPISLKEFNSLVKDLGGFRSDLQEYNAKLFEQNEHKLRFLRTKRKTKGNTIYTTKRRRFGGRRVREGDKNELREKFGFKN